MTKYMTLEELLEELGKRESSGNYSAVNNFGYLGKYQMGEGALSDIGYYKGSSPGVTQEWRGKFSGKDNVYSKEDFLKNQQAQENAIREHLKRQWQILQSNGSTKYVGSKINGIEITPSGLLAGAHLSGGGNVTKYLRTNGRDIHKDGFGTSVEKYMRNFGGYDVSELIDPNYYAPKIAGTKEEFNNKVINQGKNLISAVASQYIPKSSAIDSALSKVPVPPPLSYSEWLKRLRRDRMGLY